MKSPVSTLRPGSVPSDDPRPWRSLAVLESPGLGPRDRRDASARISVVLSFFNEEEVLGELIRRLRAVFDQLTAAGEISEYELIFVNDASTDGSERMLRQAALERPDVKLINMSRNFGVSPCVLAGMQRAAGDAVVYMDADLQDPPEVIVELVRAWKADPQVEVVHTVRRTRAGESFVKLAITRLGYAILRAVSTIDLPLEAGDFKLLSRRAVDYVTRFGEKRPFLRGLVCWIGFKHAIVPYHRQARHSGTTKFRVLGLKVIRNFIDSAMISFSDAPLKASAALGLFFSAGALVYMVWVLFQWSRGQSIPGWSATMVAVLFLGGVQLLSIGVLGTYISSIFLEVKGRPNFIVKDTFGVDTPPEADVSPPDRAGCTARGEK